MPPVTRREILALALPAMASGVLNNAFRIIDQYAAGGISTPAQAAIGSSVFPLIATWGVYQWIAAGAGPLVARATGAGDEALRRRALGNALTATLVLGVVIGVVGVVAAGGIASVLGLTGETHAEAVTFLRTLYATGLPLAFAPVVDAILVATGRTGTMMGLEVLAAALNAALNPLFIHTFGLGVAGAAIATSVSRLVAIGLGVGFLVRSFRPRLPDFRPDATLSRMARVGGPMALTTVMYAVVYFFLLRYAISPLGAVQNAALGIGFSALEGVSYPVFAGLSVAIASIVGRRLGAGQPEEARRAVRLAFPLVTACGAGAGLLFGFAGPFLCAPFTHDPAVLAAAAVYARVLAWSQVLVAWEALAEGVLGGAGATRSILVWSVPVNAVRIPLGWALAFPLGLGAAGVWWAINATSAIKALGKGWLAARGDWTRHVV